MAMLPVTSPAYLLKVSRRQSEILKYSASTEVSPSFVQYRTLTTAKVKSRMRRQGLNNFDTTTWQQLISEEWPRHCQAAWVMYLRRLPDPSFHGRDHAINEI